MEKIKINKTQIVNKGQSISAKAILNFMIENFTDEVKLTVFRQENPTNIRVPAQLNTFAGHKLLGTFDNEAKIFESFGLEEEGLSEIMTHKGEPQWLNPYNK